MKRQVPKMTTDEEAEAFLDRDLSDLDFTQFRPATFKFPRETGRTARRLVTPPTAKTTGLPPAAPAPRSGIYEQRGPRGGRTGPHADSTRGKPLPPTPKGGIRRKKDG
jgi:hypothetical protein